MQLICAGTRLQKLNKPKSYDILFTEFARSLELEANKMNQKQRDNYIKGWQKRKKQKEEELKYISEQAMEKAKRISQLLKSKYKIDEIILFGSLAENKFRKNSDIDIAIINSNKEKYFEMVKEAYDIAAPYRLDLLPIEDASSFLKKKIKMKGVQL